MDAVPAALIVGALAVAGNVSRGKTPGIGHAVGVGGVAVSLALLQQANTKLATGFAWLIILSMAIIHIPTIVKNVYGDTRGGTSATGSVGSGLW